MVDWCKHTRAINEILAEDIKKVFVGDSEELQKG